MSEEKDIEQVPGQIVNVAEVPFESLPLEQQIAAYKQAINNYKIRIRELEDDNGALAFQMAADRGLQVPKVAGQRSVGFAEQVRDASGSKEMMQSLQATVESQRRQIESLMELLKQK